MLIMGKKYRAWVLSVLFTTTIILNFIAGFNYCIDPYGVYHFTGKSYNYLKIKTRDPYQFKTIIARDYSLKQLFWVRLELND